MSDLASLLHDHEILYGISCRDATLTDIELMARTGYHVVWLDMEHGPQSLGRVLELIRTINHLSMVPMVRIPELSRSYVQRLLDGGVQILCVPQVENVAQARRIVRLGKYPPMGRRGVATAIAAIQYERPTDLLDALRIADEMTHLMAMIESDTGHRNLESILGVHGIDLVTVGPLDWAVAEHLLDAPPELLEDRVDGVLSAANAAGKITVMSAADPGQASHYRSLGVRILFLGGDVDLKRRTLKSSIETFQAALGAA